MPTQRRSPVNTSSPSRSGPDGELPPATVAVLDQQDMVTVDDDGDQVRTPWGRSLADRRPRRSVQH